MKLRATEWVILSYFLYIAVITPGFLHRPTLGFQPFLLLVCVSVGFFCLNKITVRINAIEHFRNFLPVGLMLLAFRELDWFSPVTFDSHYENIWVRWDHVLLDDWGWRNAIEGHGKLLPFYLETCYLLTYVVGICCVVALYLAYAQSRIDRFLLFYVLGTLFVYALIPYFPSQPPRLVFPDLDAPLLHTSTRTLNLWLLRKATIHSGVFPSAHVSSVFAAAWGMFSVLPERKVFGWVLLVYACSVAVATVYGRYHYAADAVAGFGVSVVVGLLLNRKLRRSFRVFPNQ